MRRGGDLRWRKSSTTEMLTSTRIEFEGIPAVCCISEAFSAQAEYQARCLGCADAARVFVPHPIIDQTPEELRAKAHAVFPALITALTENSDSRELSSFVESVEASSGPPEECCTT